MKIISWNCRGKFREKYSYILSQDADIYVIQECENPEKHKKQFAGFLPNYIWYGLKDSKGLGIFAKEHVKLTQNNWPTYCLRHFISVNVNDSVDLIGVWASPPYIEEYYIYQSVNFDRFTENTIIIGDFNSNARWDKEHGERNHTAVVQKLKTKNIVSAYHYVTRENAGLESQSTFQMYKHKDKKYHIDYCFLSPTKLKHFSILDAEAWMEHSDHFPIQVTIQDN